MTISEKIKKDFMIAYKNKDFHKKNLLWLIKWEILLIEKNKLDATDDNVFKIIKKLLKGINETIETNPTDELILEKNILLEYLPKQLTEKEISDIILKEDLINVKSSIEFFNKNYKGMVNNAIIAKIIKSK